MVSNALTAVRDGMNLISAVQQMPEVFAHIRVVVGHDDQFAMDNRFGPRKNGVDEAIKDADLGRTRGVDRTPPVRRQPSLRLLGIHVGRDSNARDGSCRLDTLCGGRVHRAKRNRHRKCTALTRRACRVDVAAMKSDQFLRRGAKPIPVPSNVRA